MIESNILIIDPLFSKNLKMYNQLIKKLDESGIKLSVSIDSKALIEVNKVILLSDPINDKNFSEKHKVLGQRTLNRKERLEIAEKIDEELVVNWCAPQNNLELKEKVKRWRNEHIILKYDWSYGKRGVKAVQINNTSLLLPKNFDSRKDVIMEFLTEDPYTYKVDLLSGVILNSWILKTKSILDKEFLSFSPPPEIFELPVSLKRKLKKLSLTLLNYGAGYISVDLMKDKGNFKIIEINTCSVGRNISWSNFFNIYLKNYAIAIKETLLRLDNIPNYEEIKTTLLNK